MQNILVSIIIPVYKVEQYIIRCIDSVLHQTYRNLEVVLVDDCSPDHSMEKAHQCIDKSPLSKDLQFKYLKHDHNRGLSAARNTGINAASGEYIYFLDSDDEITPDCVEVLISPIKNRDYDMVMANYKTSGIRESLRDASLYNGEIVGRRNIVEARRKELWYLMAWNKLIRIQFIKENHLEFCEGAIHEDVAFAAETACVMESLYCVGDAITYDYKIRSNSIMTSLQYDKRIASFIKLLNHMYIFMVTHDLLKDPYSNDLLSTLFLYANIAAYKKSLAEFNDKYPIFRRCVNRHFGERFFANNRLRGFVSTSHFLLTVTLGKIVYKKLNLRVSNQF